MYADKKPDKVDPNEQRLSKWLNCGLSNEPLREPCVVDKLGNIFNKEALVEAFLGKKLPKEFGHIKGLSAKASKEYSQSNFNGVEQYARNKRVQVALTENWAERYKNNGIGFYSMHPSWAETPGTAKSLPSFSQKLSGKLRTSEEGADTVIWLALQPKEKLVSGAFYFDRAEAPKHLKFVATSGSHDVIDSIVDSLHSMAALSP